MQHRVTWFDRLRIECAVWALDQRLYDLPRHDRIETRREVRRNLLSGAGDIGTTRALRNLGGSGQLAGEYLAASFGARPRHSWTAAGLVGAGIPFLATWIFGSAADAFSHGVAAADGASGAAYTWDGIWPLQGTVTSTLVDGDVTWTGGAFTPLFYVLWILAAVLAGRLWRVLPHWRSRARGAERS